MSEFDFLEEQGVSAALIKAAEEFRQEYGVSEEAKHRRIKPALPFYGKETLEMAMAAVLEQENLLLAGPKATGKNVLAENLAYIFGRPVYNVSFHVNTNSGDLIGTDTFVDNQVKLRKGSIYQCAEEGGFGILDEINIGDGIKFNKYYTVTIKYIAPIAIIAMFIQLVVNLLAS